MNTWHDWIDIHIHPLYVKAAMEKKIDWKQNIEGNVKTRWCGTIGEEAFRILCDDFKTPFIDRTLNGPSFVDFELMGKKIDVKTVATNYYPSDKFACDINQKQFERNTEADTYVFMRYIIPTYTIVILGWIDKYELGKNALYRTAGTKVTQSFTTSVEMMEIEIPYLNPIRSLFDI